MLIEFFQPYLWKQIESLLFFSNLICLNLTLLQTKQEKYFKWIHLPRWILETLAGSFFVEFMSIIAEVCLKFVNISKALKHTFSSYNLRFGFGMELIKRISSCGMFNIQCLLWVIVACLVFLSLFINAKRYLLKGTPCESMIFIRYRRNE